MWRQISRGVRESWEKCNIFNNGKDVTIRQKEPQINSSPAAPTCRLRLVPCLVESLFRKQPVVQDKPNVDVGERHEKKDSKDENCNTSSNSAQQCFLGAMGWSGALVLGYMLSQRMWSKNLWCHESKAEPLKCDIQLNLVKRLSKIAETKPINNPIYKQQQLNLAIHTNTGQHVNTPLPQVVNQDEALNAAIEELRLAHEKVIGEAENRRGVACLSKNCNREAIEHFRRASHFNNAPAAFNLGQCYELGIGTKQDFKQAAEWYKLASDRGHPTAMYNLGVFYAHGWGGLIANVSRARHLFHQAARLGQVDAQAAIDRDPEHYNETADKTLLFREDKRHIVSALEHLINFKHLPLWNVQDN